MVGSKSAGLHTNRTAEGIGLNTLSAGEGLRLGRIRNQESIRGVRREIGYKIRDHLAERFHELFLLHVARVPSLPGIANFCQVKKHFSIVIHKGETEMFVLKPYMMIFAECLRFV